MKRKEKQQLNKVRENLIDAIKSIDYDISKEAQSKFDFVFYDLEYFFDDKQKKRIIEYDKKGWSSTSRPYYRMLRGEIKL